MIAQMNDFYASDIPRAKGDMVRIAGTQTIGILTWVSQHKCQIDDMGPLLTWCDVVPAPCSYLEPPATKTQKIAKRFNDARATIALCAGACGFTFGAMIILQHIVLGVR